MKSFITVVNTLDFSLRSEQVMARDFDKVLIATEI